MIRLIEFDRFNVREPYQPAWADGGAWRHSDTGFLPHEARFSFLPRSPEHIGYNSDGLLNVQPDHLGTMIDLYC